MSKIELFKILSEYNPITHQSRFVHIKEFINKYSIIYSRNGGLARGWERKHQFIKVYNNGYIWYSWDVGDDQKEKIKTEVEQFRKENNYITYTGSGTQTQLLKIYGLQDKNIYRPIRNDILQHYKEQPCCACGSRSNLVCDHKNDLYNDDRVLDIHTQTLDDFQCLCTHCNLQKRQVNKKTRQTNKRYGATNIPSLETLEVDFIEGDETYDKDDVNAMKGTYWYDVVEFHRVAKRINEEKTRARLLRCLNKTH